jgi:hypothetical protein
VAEKTQLEEAIDAGVKLKRRVVDLEEALRELVEAAGKISAPAPPEGVKDLRWGRLGAAVDKARNTLAETT